MVDVAAAVRSMARALPLTVGTPEPEPTIALLEGPSQARVGEETAYRVRVYNPTGARRSFDVAIAGWCDGDAAATFRLEWTADLEPGATDERWVTTDWRGRAVLVARAPDAPATWTPSDTRERWHVEARVSEAHHTPVLHAAGDLVR